MPRDIEQALAALTGAYDAHTRLTDLGLAGTNTDGRANGINANGFQTTGDLAAVLMLQGQNGTHAEQVLSTTCRALLSALAAVAAEASGQPMQTRTQLAQTHNLLTDAAAIATLRT